MLGIYRKVRLSLQHACYWVLDYSYISYWQLKGVVDRKGYQNSHKVNSSSKLPSVVVIPGVYENWYFMRPILSLLAGHNYDVHIIRTLGYNRGTIEKMSERVDAYIREHNLQDVVIVAHSKGGLIGKYLMMQNDSAVKGMIAISTPFSGSVYAMLAPLRSVRIFRPTSSILTLLRENSKVNNRIVSIYGEFDPHIPGGSNLDGATNIRIPTGGHFRIINNKKVHKAIIRHLVDFV